ncbi:MAG: hypothetical protein MUF53_08915, partial [Gemmatimonadaceae bacterium]|nr:hypothetical protein [Gemmatimonadaceae bacterium]
MRLDEVHRVLDTVDPAEALRAADAQRLASGPFAQNYRPSMRPLGPPVMPGAVSPGAGPTSPLPERVDLIRLAEPLLLPPVLTPLQPLRLDPATALQSLRFAVRAATPVERIRIELRVDGRLVDPERVQMPVAADGVASGEVVVRLSPDASAVQLVARMEQIASEPLRFALDAAPRPSGTPVAP